MSWWISKFSWRLIHYIFIWEVSENYLWKKSKTPSSLFIGCLLLYIHLFNLYIHISFSLRHTRTKHSMWYIKRVFIVCAGFNHSLRSTDNILICIHTVHTHIWMHHKQLHMALCIDLTYGQQTSTKRGTNLEINQWQSIENWMWAVWTNIKHSVKFTEKSYVSLFWTMFQ